MMDYGEFAEKAKSATGRCVVLARHGERPGIDPSDPTFGRTLPLTAAGEALARACGRELRGVGTPENWTFGASSLRRTMLTAQYVAEEIGASPDVVENTPEVGIPGLWIEDALVVHAAQKRMGVRNYHEEQMRIGRAEGFWDVEDCTRRVLAWLSGKSIRTRYAFYSTHDCHLGYLLNGLGAANIDTAHWVGFLQGCALFEQTDGSWHAHYIVPDKERYANGFVF